MTAACQAGDKTREDRRGPFTGRVRAGRISVQSGNDLYIKGLVYSGNERVKLESEAFGGLRNHIIYNIDTRYLEDGDTVKGSFYLVTNGGEKEIPYSLRIQTGNRTEELGSLKPQGILQLWQRKLGTGPAPV